MDDTQHHNAVEGKTGQDKRRYGLSLNRDKPAVNKGSTVELNGTAMNQQKQLENHVVLFTH